MNRRRRKPNYQAFWMEVTNTGKRQCALRGVAVDCAGPRDAHHFLFKRKIKLQLGRAAESALLDVRNGVCLCRRHHDLVHSPVNPLACPPPPDYLAFLADHGLHDSRRPAEQLEI